VVASILRTERLAKRFGGVVATDNVSIDVPQGELRCIIGPNGAGKSTLFSLLTGIDRPDAGSVHLKGEDVTRLPAFRRVRRGLGLTFQTNRSFHRLSVRQNLEAVLDLPRHDRPPGLAFELPACKGRVSALGLELIRVHHPGLVRVNDGHILWRARPQDPQRPGEGAI